MDRSATVTRALGSPEGQAAIRERRYGAVVRLVRKALGMSQEELGAAISCSQRRVSRLERHGIRDVADLRACRDALSIPAAALGLSDERPTLAPTGAGFVPAPRTTLPTPRSARGRTIDDAVAMQAFRDADRNVGGGHLYRDVIRYLETHVAPRLVGSAVDVDSQELFTSAAAFVEMGAWMAHDAGRDDVAERHFRRSLDLVHVGRDRQLTAHVYASMSHLAHHTDRADAAIAYAQRGQQVLAGGPRNPELDARLLAMQARGMAALRKPAECIRLLMRAEDTLSARHDEAPSPWVSHFDAGSLASEAARCMRHLGDVSETQRQAELVLQTRPAEGTRSRAFGQLALVAALVAQGRPEEACSLAGQVLTATKSLGSALVLQQLLDLREQLQPYQQDPAVAEFLSCLGTSLRTRLWLSEWQTSNDDEEQAE